MKTKINRALLILAASTFAFSGAIEVAKADELNQHETTNIVELFAHKGKFKGIKVVNDVIGLKVEIFLDKNGHPPLGLDQPQDDQDQDQIERNYKNSNGFHFIVTKLENNETIASGNIALGLEWIAILSATDKADVVKEIINKLKEQGITAMIAEEDDILVITIKRFNESEQPHDL